jgi:hypothetical protein
MSDQSPLSTDLPPQKARAGSTAFHISMLMIAAIVARVAWMLVIPYHAMSVDLNDWHRLAEGLELGMNPYARDILTWPPFWMEIVYLCLRFSTRFGLD